MLQKTLGKKNTNVGKEKGPWPRRVSSRAKSNSAAVQKCAWNKVVGRDPLKMGEQQMIVMQMIDMATGKQSIQPHKVRLIP